jgi:hypothetical protein
VVVRGRQANAMLAFDLGERQAGAVQSHRSWGREPNASIKFGLESVAFAPRPQPWRQHHCHCGASAARRDDIRVDCGVGAFAIVRHDGLTSAVPAFLPDGDLLLLERRFSPARGIGMRLRRIEGDAVAVGARLDGDYLLDAGMTSQIDNMEGLDVSRDRQGRTILTLVSDNNYNIFQRTLILQFALPDR